MNLENIPNREQQFDLICKVFYLLSIASGIVMMVLSINQIINGFGLGTLILALYAYQHFYHSLYHAKGQIENSFTTMLAILFVIGCAVIIVNHYFGKSSFIQGFGAAIGLYSGLMYCIQLFRNYMNSVR